MSRPALVVLVLAVAVLLGSLLFGLRGEPRASAAGAAAEPPAREQRVRVEVLNAAGVPRLARETTERLRDRGFDVVYYGNAREFGRQETLVLDRLGNEEAAREVADALNDAAWETRVDSGRYVDVTVLVGADLAPPAEQAADSVSSPRS